MGTRNPSERGRGSAGTLAEALVAANRTVVSGLAVGIDTAAHLAALRAGGRTVAVLGTGITRSYPAANAELQGRIGREGMLLSQFWPEAPPRRHSFLQRNATISGRELSQRPGVYVATTVEDVLDLLDDVVWSHPESVEPLYV